MKQTWHQLLCAGNICRRVDDRVALDVSSKVHCPAVAKNGRNLLAIVKTKRCWAVENDADAALLAVFEQQNHTLRKIMLLKMTHCAAVETHRGRAHGRSVVNDVTTRCSASGALETHGSASSTAPGSG